MKAFTQTRAVLVGMLASLLLFSLPAFGRQQIIGVPAGAAIDFTKGQSTVPAYCLEKAVRGFPSADQALPNVTGKVRIEFRQAGRAPLEIDAADAASRGLLSFYGKDPKQSYTATIKADPSVARVTFMTPSALGQKEAVLSGSEWKQVHAQAETLLSRTKEGLDAEENQQLVHLNKQLLIEERLEKDNMRLVRTVNRDPERFMRASYYRLKSQGDASLVKTPGGAYILHDAGASDVEMQAILESVEADEAGVKRISVCITHPDLDHYKGLGWLLDAQKKSNGKIVVSNIIIGALPEKVHVNAAGDFSPRFAELLRQVKADYALETTEGTYAHFRNANATGRQIEVERDLIDEGIARADIDDLKLTFLQFEAENATTAGHRHAQNLVTVYQHDKFAIADFGDALPEHFRAMLRTPRDEALAERKHLENRVAEHRMNIAFAEEVMANRSLKPAQLAARIEATIAEMPANLRDGAKEMQRLLETAEPEPVPRAKVKDEARRMSRLFALEEQLAAGGTEAVTRTGRLKALIGLKTELIKASDLADVAAELLNLRTGLQEAIAEQKKALELPAFSVPPDLNPDIYIRRGLEVTATYEDFQCQVVKWPHHAWMPRTEKDVGIMKAWLKVYRPEELVINVPFDPERPEAWAASRARVKEIRQLVKEAIDEEAAAGRVLPTRVRSTEDEGLQFEAMLLVVRALLAA